jgi:hypothetical protein
MLNSGLSQTEQTVWPERGVIMESKNVAPATTTGTTVKRSKPSITPACERVRPLKKALCLWYLYRHSLVKLEALDLYGDTCLHSTISDLANNHGLEFKRVPEAHHHQYGGVTYFTRYTLMPESRPAAAALLKHWGMEVAA